MRRGLESRDVQGAVGRPQVTGGHQDHVYQGPDAQAPEAEELANALLPHAQVEAVRTKATEHDAEHKCCRPAIAPGPIAEQIFVKLPPA